MGFHRPGSSRCKSGRAAPISSSTSPTIDTTQAVVICRNTTSSAWWSPTLARRERRIQQALGLLNRSTMMLRCCTMPTGLMPFPHSWKTTPSEHPRHIKIPAISPCYMSNTYSPALKGLWCSARHKSAGTEMSAGCKHRKGAEAVSRATCDAGIQTAAYQSFGSLRNPW